MELIEFNDFIQKYSNVCLCAAIGEFDGVHLAHQYLINQAVLSARKLQISSAVISFNPHPKMVLSENDAHYLITTTDEKISRFQVLDVDFCIIIPFDKNFSQNTKEQFINNYLLKLNLNTLYCGFNYHFGYHGEGSASDLSAILNFKTVIVDEIKNDDGLTISSTNIRRLLSVGDIINANKLLGFEYFITGSVIEGRKVGRTIGFPTANIHAPKEKLLPISGVYAIYSIIDDVKYYGMLNIGHNPTFNYQENYSVEVNYFNLNKDLYNQDLTIYLLEFIRPEKKYDSKQALVDELKFDRSLIQNKYQPHK